MPSPPRRPVNFREILQLIWWRLDRALDEETIYLSALAGAIDAARAGTTCVFDHHSSPSHISGSLQVVREAIQQIGLRAVLCYEVTDRGGLEERDQGTAENRSFLEWCDSAGSSSTDGTDPRSLFRAMIGAHASFTLSDDSLNACADLIGRFNSGLHIHAAEDACDVEDAHDKYGIGVVERLGRVGVLNSKTILAHGVHLDERDAGRARAANAWFAHSPRSNMNNQVGYPPISTFGRRLLIGTDGIGADMFEEARFAFFKGRDARAACGAEDWMRALVNNQRLASEMFNVRLDTLEAGASADLIVLNYQTPTPLTSANLASHMLFGVSSASVESVMIAGRFIVKDRKFSIDVGALYERARRASDRLWGRLSK
jgi:putative selenium metabolism protein SsnA